VNAQKSGSRVAFREAKLCAERTSKNIKKPWEYARCRFCEKTIRRGAKVRQRKRQGPFGPKKLVLVYFFCHWSLEILLFLMSREKSHYVGAAIWPGFFFFARHAAWECKK